MEHRDGNRREHRERNSFLDDFQLHQAEWPAVDTAPDVVCGNHETVLQERDAPRSENHENQRPVGADVHFFEFEVAVPSERHKDVGTAKKKNCKNTSFHVLVISKQWLGIRGWVRYDVVLIPHSSSLFRLSSVGPKVRSFV